MSRMLLDNLAPLPVWVGWREEIVGGRKTKVPYDPRTGRPASCTIPSTWVPRDEAEDWAATSGGHGVGIMLGALDGGSHILCGIDLDSCRNPETEEIDPWAKEICHKIDSYTEVSPSGTGLKIFFFHAGADLATIERIFDGQRGRQFKRGNGVDHPPAIEIYRAGRYFTVTGDSVGAGDTLRQVPAVDIDWLVRDAGPRFAPKPSDGQYEAGRDNSRSAKALAKGASLGRRAASYEDMKAALLADGDPEIAEWARTKGVANKERELKRIYNKVAEGQEPPPGANHTIASRPTIRLSADLYADISACQRELISSEQAEVYQRVGRLVRRGTDKGKDHLGKTVVFDSIAEFNPNSLRTAVAKAIIFEKWDSNSRKFKECQPPKDYMGCLLDHSEKDYPVLHGRVSAPALRHDGSILDVPGYDEETGLYFDPKGVEFGEIPEYPANASGRP